LLLSMAFPSVAVFVFISTVLDMYGSSFFPILLRLSRLPKILITELQEICSRHCCGSATNTTWTCF
jgi:hypothetical protein